MKKFLKLFLIMLVLGASPFMVTGCSNKVEGSESKIVNDGKGEVYLLLNTEGLGQVAYYINDDNKVEFDDEYPSQQAYKRLTGETKVTINAKADNDWKFVNWTKDGKEYSKEAELEITVNSATELTAVFEMK